jgi:hypothetical protein
MAVAVKLLFEYKSELSNQRYAFKAHWRPAKPERASGSPGRFSLNHEAHVNELTHNS